MNDGHRNGAATVPPAQPAQPQPAQPAQKTVAVTPAQLQQIIDAGVRQALSPMIRGLAQIYERVPATIVLNAIAENTALVCAGLMQGDLVGALAARRAMKDAFEAGLAKAGPPKPLPGVAELMAAPVRKIG